jgi:hypothetical protein
MNPDGFVARQRHNVRGVDLNRNFPYSWSRYTYAAGQAPGSEAETQTMVNFMDRLRPDASLIFHQDWNQVLGTCNSKTRPRAYRYAALAGIPPERCFRAYTGTMGSWYNYLYPGYALTVELPSTRRITPLRINRFAGSVIRLAQETPNFDPTSVLPDTPAPDPSESSEPPAAD